MRRSWMRAVTGLAAIVWGCDAAAPVAPPSPDAVEEPASELTAAPAPPRPDHATFLVSTMQFTFEASEGVAPGFNLDGLVSSGDDDSGCGIEDQTSPDGIPGVDNQLARFMPFIEAAGINQLPEYLQGAIVEGGIVMLGVIEGLDDRVDDPDVRMLIVRGQGRPLLDLDDAVTPWQTVGLDEQDTILGVSIHAEVVDGRVIGTFESLRLPALLFDVYVDLQLSHARFSFPLEQGDPRPGFGSGAVTMAQILEIIEKTPSGNLGEVITSLGPSLVDMDSDGDGECDALSAALQIGVVPAYLTESHQAMVRTRASAAAP